MTYQPTFPAPRRASSGLFGRQAPSHVSERQAQPVLEGWPASPNPFEPLHPEQTTSDSMTGFSASIESMLDRALEWRSKLRWAIAEDYFQSAIWMAVAANDVDACIVAGVRLAECYLAVGDERSARNLATHLIPLAALKNDGQHLLTLCTVRCMSCGAMLTAELARRELDECARLAALHGGQAVPTGRLDGDLFATVGALLDAAGDRARLSVWREAWSRLSAPGGAGKASRRGGFLRPRAI